MNRTHYSRYHVSKRSKHSQKISSKKASSLPEEEENEIIRCICRSQAVFGLMIQCEVCKVWQHCSCVDILDEKQCPDDYYCEQCISPEAQTGYKDGKVERNSNRKRNKIRKSHSSASSNSNASSYEKENLIIKNKSSEGDATELVSSPTLKHENKIQNGCSNKPTHIKLVSKALDLNKFKPNPLRASLQLEKNLDIKNNPIVVNTNIDTNHKKENGQAKTIKLLNNSSSVIHKSNHQKKSFSNSSDLDNIKQEKEFTRVDFEEETDNEAEEILRREYKRCLKKPQIEEILEKIIKSSNNKKEMNRDYTSKPRAVSTRITNRDIKRRITQMENYINSIKREELKEPIQSMAEKLSEELEMFRQKYI